MDMNKNHRQILKLYEEFVIFVKEIHGFYLDSLMGYEVILNDIEEQQSFARKLFEDNNSAFGVEFLCDGLSFSHQQIFSKATYFSGNNHQGESYAGSGMHNVTLGELKKRNDPKGDNCRLLGNTCIVMLYSYWEHYFRPAITKAMGLTEDLKDPLWGDLRMFRNSILHRKGKALPEIEKAEMFLWYEPGDMIFIDQKKFRDIIYELFRFSGWIHNESLPKSTIKIRKTKQ